MSKEHIEKIKCPECGQECEITIWDSLNGDIDPDAKQQLLDGTLFRFHCEKCGHQSNLSYDILYHDMTNKAMVYFVRPEAVESTIEELIAMEEKLPVKMDDYKKRVVCDQNALREKAIIFNNELDDRVIEIIKLMYLANAAKQFPDKEITAVYVMIDQDGEMSLQFMTDEPLSCSVPNDLYDKIRQKFAANIDAVGDADFVVDIEWAKRALS